MCYHPLETSSMSCSSPATRALQEILQTESPSPSEQGTRTDIFSMTTTSTTEPSSFPTMFLLHDRITDHTTTRRNKASSFSSSLSSSVSTHDKKRCRPSSRVSCHHHHHHHVGQRRGQEKAVSSFDMTTILQVSEDIIEESIAFPTIEWSFTDDCPQQDQAEKEKEPFLSSLRSSRSDYGINNAFVSKEDDHEGEDWSTELFDLPRSPPKRRCYGLNRSVGATLDLPSLVSSSDKTFTCRLFGNNLSVVDDYRNTQPSNVRNTRSSSNLYK